RRPGRLVAGTDREDQAVPLPGSDDGVLRLSRAVHEVPRTERPLLALDDQQRLAREDEEVLLVGLPVVHRQRLAGREPGQLDPDLRELGLALEDAGLSAPF